MSYKETKSEDQTIMEGVREGNKAAFSRLQDTYFPILYASAVSFVHDRDAAKDIVNTLLVKAWQHREYLRHPVRAQLIFRGA